MKPGDLVRHRFDGRWDEVGLVTSIRRITPSMRGGMYSPAHNQKLASVLWNHTGVPIAREYRVRDLEIVNECR